MPRRNRRAEPPGRPAPIGPGPSAEHHPDGQWHVRTISAGASTKDYRCPGCQQLIRPGAAHLVAWPADSRDGAEERRHWHHPCWNARLRRPPR